MPWPEPSTSEQPLAHQESSTFRARLMFLFSLAFLVVLAGLLHRHRLPDPANVKQELQRVGADMATWVEMQPSHLDKPELMIQLGLLAILWPIFFLESLVRFFHRPAGCFWSSLGGMLLIWIFPPTRMGMPGRRPQDPLWLPWLGWCSVDRKLRVQLESKLSLPMVFIALFVLPLLVIEFALKDHMEEHAGLALFVNASNGVIWLAFTVELIVMLAVAPKKLAYCARHWVDLAIILLPFLHFLPLARLLRVGRIMRLEQLTRMSRLYRLQGLALKGWRSVLLLNLLQVLTGMNPARKLAQLEHLLQTKREEMADLEAEIIDLRRLIAEQERTLVPEPEPSLPYLPEPGPLER